MRALDIASFSFLAVASTAAFAKGEAPSSSAESAVCKSLHIDYEEASKRMSQNRADGLGDNSAVRATQRETENNGILAEARLTLDLLKGNDCRLPTSAPSSDRYYFTALKCHNDILEVKLSGTYSFPASCKRADWVPDEPKPAN